MEREGNVMQKKPKGRSPISRIEALKPSLNCASSTDPFQGVMEID